MSKGIYVGVDGFARKVKNVYIGIDGVARKIKKAYIGVGGVARPCFGTDINIEYYGTVTDLDMTNSIVLGSTIGEYALFLGLESYYNNDGSRLYIEAYNSAITKTKINTMFPQSSNRYVAASAQTNNYAVFGCSTTGSDSNSLYDTAIVLNPSLTQTYITLSASRQMISIATIDNFILFGGGGHGANYSNIVDAFDVSLTRTLPTPLGIARREIKATAISGSYAMFGTGLASSEYAKTGDAYNSSLTKTNFTTWNTRDSFATSVGSYAVFGCGDSVYDTSGNVLYYAVGGIFDSSLTYSMQKVSNVARKKVCVASTGQYALLAGGDTKSGLTSDVDVIDESLTLTNLNPLSISRRNIGGAIAGDKYVLFAGGAANTGATKMVDAYIYA